MRLFPQHGKAAQKIAVAAAALPGLDLGRKRLAALPGLALLALLLGFHLPPAFFPILPGRNHGRGHGLFARPKAMLVHKKFAEQLLQLFGGAVQRQMPIDGPGGHRPGGAKLLIQLGARPAEGARKAGNA